MSGDQIYLSWYEEQKFPGHLIAVAASKFSFTLPPSLILINSLTVLKLSQNKAHNSDTRHIQIICILCLSVQLRMVEFDD